MQITATCPYSHPTALFWGWSRTANSTWIWFSPLAFDLLYLFSTPLQTWWSGSLSLPTRFQIYSITWTTSLLQAPPSLLSANWIWLLVWKSVNSLVYHCILASVWAPAQCLLSWASSSPVTKWHVPPGEVAIVAKSDWFFAPLKMVK